MIPASVGGHLPVRLSLEAEVRDRLGLGEPAALCTKQYCEIAEIVTS